MNTEIMANGQTKDLATLAHTETHAEECLAADMVIPRLLLMQGLSDFVAEGKAKMGEIVRSTTETIVGGKEKRLEIIPITFRNMWRLEECPPGQKAIYRGTEPRNAGNDHLPWEYKKDGMPWKRVKVIELFAILPEDIEADISNKTKAASGELPDLDKTLLPVSIQFRSTGFTAGRAVSSHFVKAQSNKVAPYAYSLSLGCYLDKNDKGSFYVWDIGAKTTAIKKEYFQTVTQMAEMLRPLVAANKVQVDESLDDEGSTKDFGSIKPGEEY